MFFIEERYEFSVLEQDCNKKRWLVLCLTALRN